MFPLKEAKSKNDTKLTDNDLKMFNNIITYPISMNYSGGKQKTKYGGSILNDLKSFGNSIMSSCQNLQSLN